VAWTIAGTLVAPAVILAGTLYPRFSKAAADPEEFRRVLRKAFRPLMFVAVLGAVGTYLFADVAVALIYSKQRFGQAASILRVFAPTLLLLYVEMVIGMVLLALGKAGRLASIKLAAVIVTTGMAFLLIPAFQARYGNGGMGIMVAMGAGEVVVVTASILMLRETFDPHVLVDAARAMLAGAVTLVFMWWLPALTPFVTIPVCILVFFGMSLALGLVNRSDIELLTATFRKRGSAADISPGDTIGAPQPPVAAAVEPLSPRAP
jgi:O-antigen/teichoic acid export membrane protein